MPSKKQDFVKWSRRDFVPTHEWPRAISSLLAKSNISNMERYKSFCFFYGNGVSPNKIREFMYCFNLNKEAKRHVEYLIKNKKTNWTYWDVLEKHSKTFRGVDVKIKAELHEPVHQPFPLWKLREARPPLRGGGPGVWRVPQWRDPPRLYDDWDFRGYFWDPRLQ